ncbi:lyase family protein [Microbispora sp. NPDC049125]|uniref:lyase family protein n=1 Tax=Microbispora sp. NPDC049125 TaxID=3154929 RepID=UPI003466DBC0
MITRAPTAEKAAHAAGAAVRELGPDSAAAGDPATGRLLAPAFPSVRQMLFEERPAAHPDRLAELRQISTVDLAHVAMLAERRIIEAGPAAVLLRAILDLRASGYAALAGAPMQRGVYLAYERHLIEQAGDEIGGVLHTGRSRNDLNATCLLLHLRPVYRRLTGEMVRLGHVLFGRARRHRATMMPAYTHFQPAVPITYGHYLLGVAAAVGRDLDPLRHAGTAMATCPLGAGAVGGTTVPIDAARTAELLGFDAPVVNSLDAVASRTAILYLLAAMTSLATTLDRVALDLLLWSGQEFGFLTMPDGLVGSSSMMPQKRNVFVLEHVQGMTVQPLGSFVSAVSAMRGTPFTNSVAVGTEAVRPVWPALRAMADAVRITRMAIARGRPDPGAFQRRADAGLTAATAPSEQLVAQGVPSSGATGSPTAEPRRQARGGASGSGTVVVCSGAPVAVAGAGPARRIHNRAPVSRMTPPSSQGIGPCGRTPMSRPVRATDSCRARDCTDRAVARPALVTRRCRRSFSLGPDAPSPRYTSP